MSYVDRVVPADEIERARKRAATRLRVISHDVGRAHLARGTTNADRIALLLKSGEDMETVVLARSVGIQVADASRILSQMVLRGEAVRVARGLYRCAP